MAAIGSLNPAAERKLLKRFCNDHCVDFIFQSAGRIRESLTR